MWSYKKTKLGYKIIKKNKKQCLTFTLPYTYQDKNIIMYWDDTKIIKLVNDLNERKIPISINIERENVNKPIGLKVSFTLSKKYNEYHEWLK